MAPAGESGHGRGMAVYTQARYQVRPEASVEAERLMHDYAAYVRRELAGSVWTVYRDPQVAGRYLVMGRTDDRAAADRQAAASGTAAFVAALAPLVVGSPEQGECELVTSSDLAPRHREPAGRAATARRRRR